MEAHQIACLDGQFMRWGDISISPANRGLAYSDGFFETMIWDGNGVRFLEAHLARAQRACQILDLSPIMPLDQWENIFSELIDKQEVEEKYRLKATVWRMEGGLYAPMHTQAHVLLTAAPFVPAPAKPFRVGIAQTVRLQAGNPLSSFKKIAALPYVVAGIECKKRNLDDLILLNDREEVAECLSSNLFWLEDGQWKTPPLASGCLPGVMREQVIAAMAKQGFFVAECVATAQALAERATAIFITNSAGIRSISEIEGRALEVTGFPANAIGFAQ